MPSCDAGFLLSGLSCAASFASLRICSSSWLTSGSMLDQYWLRFVTFCTLKATISLRMSRRALDLVDFFVAESRLSQCPNTSDVGASFTSGAASPFT